MPFITPGCRAGPSHATLALLWRWVIMARHDWKSVNDSEPRFSGTARLVAEPVADQGVRNALQGAFACTKDMPDDFGRLLAQLR